MKIVFYVLTLLLLSACGGGGGSTPAASTTSTSATATSFTTVAMAGELLTYTVDTTKLTYSYTITASQYGLTGKTGSGTLTLNSDGTYSPSGITNAKVVVLPNGLLLGAIREIINGTLTTIPIYGVKSPVTTFAEAAGTYNYVERYCVASTCSSFFGTFKVTPDGLWNSCRSGNLTTGCTGTALSGTLNNLGGGQFQVFNGAIVIGTAITFTSGSQKVVVIDLNNATSGRGLLVGSQQESATTAQTNGTWVGTSSNQGNFKFVVSGSGSTVTATQQTFNDVANITARTATLNSPWAGMVSDGAGGIAILAGTGVYAAVVSTLPNGYAEIGVKLP